MRGHRGTPRLAAAAAAICLVASLPFLVGQGCGSVVERIDGGIYEDTQTGTNGNTAPTFRFTSPAGNVDAEVGDIVNIAWTDSDPDDNALISIILDPDSVVNNGNDVPIATGIAENDPTNSLSINTGLFGLSTGNYRIVARISDGVNPEVMVAAPGTLSLSRLGSRPGNISPTIVVNQPTQHLSVSDETQITVNYCGDDPDGGEGNVVADVIIMLDLDTDPLNDLFALYPHGDPASAVAIAQICADTDQLPAVVNGSVILGCAKDDHCANPAGTDALFTIDAARIPQPAGGEPYHVRVAMWDHTNPPANGYAAGTLSMTSLVSGTVDLGDVGRTKTGCRLISFDTGAQVGSTGTSLGDFDGDGADDFVVVARFGRPFERGSVGSAYLLYGTPGQRFGSDIYLNSFGTEYRGCEFAGGHAGPFYRYSYYYGTEVTEAKTDGITAVSSIEDMTGDGRPEILFGFPYAELWWDYHDDDPCDEENKCYYDGWPNPYSTKEPGNDDIGAWDAMEGIVTIDNPDPIPDSDVYCSNDNDLFEVTPLNQGYIIYVSSSNDMENSVIDLPMVGQKDPAPVALEEGVGVSGGLMPDGARLRGGWFSWALSTDGTGSLFSGFDPYNQFGRTLGSMPDLGNPLNSYDGRSEYLISLPTSYQERGTVLVMWGRDLGIFCTEQSVQSIPECWKAVDDPCYRGYDYPDSREIIGASPGDQLGYADRAGDFNRDGKQDILCGAPGADNGGLLDAGTIYVIYGRLDFGNLDLSQAIDPNDPNRKYIPRMEIRGTNSGDRFGQTQTLIGDVNNDGFSDIAFASEVADGPGGTDAGVIGIVFGGRALTGESVYSVSTVGSSQLPGCMFYGTQRGGHAGASIANVGDFNADGFDDLMISAPNEVRVVNGQNRRGVAYLIFGGSHLANNTTRNYFLLDEVGSDALPGIVFHSPYVQASADEATISWVGAAGDVDGDGFSDILVGLSEADFVNPYDPGQRRVDAGEAYLIYGNNSGSNVVGR